MFKIIFFILISLMPFFSLGQFVKITGKLPGKEKHKLFITYFPPGFNSSTRSDSCIINEDGVFEFNSPYKEPVLALIRFDYADGFEFVTDSTNVNIVPLYTGNSFLFSQIKAISPANSNYAAFKEFIKKELFIADSLYTIREKYRTEKKKDSIKLLEPDLDQADAKLRSKYLEYAAAENDPVIRSLVIYRKLMVGIQLEEVKNLYRELGFEGQLSIYGKAINEFILSKEGLKTGIMAPAFVNQYDVNGKKVLLENFKGKYLLIDFWAAWCVPCRAENPNMIRIYEKYKSRNFEILGISLDRSKESWIKAIKQDQLPWIHASDLKFWDNECVKLYGLYSIPFNVLISPDGKIIGINIHNEELERKLEETLK